MVDMDGTTSNCSQDIDSGSVLTETQLLSLLKEYKTSLPQWIAIPDTLTSGGDAILAINISLWPRSIQPKIRRQLLQMGGVPFESPQEAIESPEKQFVQRAMKLAIRSTASHVGPAMGVVGLGPNLI